MVEHRDYIIEGLLMEYLEIFQVSALRANYLLPAIYRKIWYNKRIGKSGNTQSYWTCL